MPIMLGGTGGSHQFHPSVREATNFEIRTMRFTKREAEEEAVRIAKEFVASNGGAHWSCGGAMPDVLSPGYRRRKDVIKWSVLFDRSIGENMVDGPAVVHVDIETGEAAFF